MKETLNTGCFNVAELIFSVSVPPGCDIGTLLPAFADFALEGVPHAVDFSLSYDDGLRLPAGLKPAVEERNDMGHTLIYITRDRVYLSFNSGKSSGLMSMDRDSLSGSFALDFSDAAAGTLLSSMTRALFAQNILLHDGISLHASCVLCQGLAYLFMGASGTGKSTHASLWIEAFPGTELLNDDNPAVRIFGDRVVAFGTPWSGKTPCYRNLCAPVRAVVRLSQAPRNVFTVKEDVAAFMEIYPGCSVLRTVPELHDCLCDNLSGMVPLIKTGHLDCLPDLDAARCCHDSLA